MEWAWSRAMASGNVHEIQCWLEERLAERTRIACDLHDTRWQGFQGMMLRLQVVDDLLPPGKAKVELERTLQQGDESIVEGQSAVQDLRLSTLDIWSGAGTGTEIELNIPGSIAYHVAPGRHRFRRLRRKGGMTL